MRLEILDWQRPLTALPGERVIAAAASLVQSWQVRHRTLPQAGLGMLKLAEDALGDVYYLGEFPVAVSHLELVLPSGECFQGAAQVMSDDADLAEALAICDAIVRNKLAGIEQLAILIEEGARLCDAEDHARRTMLSTTAVDFSDLSDAGDDDED